MKDNDDVYEVERVLATRRKSGKLEFLILWKGFRLQESTWELENNMGGSQELIDEYFENNPTRPGGKHERKAGRPSGTANPKTPKKAEAKATSNSHGKSTRATPKLVAVTPPVGEGDVVDEDSDIEDATEE